MAIDIYVEARSKNYSYEASNKWWNSVVKRYLDLEAKNKNLYEDINVVFQLLESRGCSVISDNNHKNLEYAITLLEYFNDCNISIKDLLSKTHKNRAARSFKRFLKKNDGKKVNIQQWISRYYKKATLIDSKHHEDVWRLVKPLIDTRKTRGMSGPGELPLLLLTGGDKVDGCDFKLGRYKVEMKVQGGRIGCNTVSVLDYKGIRGKDAKRNIGIAQLMDYMKKRDFDILIVFKNSKRNPKGVEFGTMIPLSKKLFKLKSFLEIRKIIKDNNISFNTHTDNQGFGIKFLAKPEA